VPCAIIAQQTTVVARGPRAWAGTTLLGGRGPSLLWAVGRTAVRVRPIRWPPGLECAAVCPLPRITPRGLPKRRVSSTCTREATGRVHIGRRAAGRAEEDGQDQRCYFCPTPEKVKCGGVR
jgi:hypothetical protein